MSGAVFLINVVEVDGDLETPYHLYNHNEPAGDRLRRHSGFPFKGDDWKRYRTRGEADSAARKLQVYLSNPPKKK